MSLYSGGTLKHLINYLWLTSVDLILYNTTESDCLIVCGDPLTDPKIATCIADVIYDNTGITFVYHISFGHIFRLIY